MKRLGAHGKHIARLPDGLRVGMHACRPCHVANSVRTLNFDIFDVFEICEVCLSNFRLWKVNFGLSSQFLGQSIRKIYSPRG